MREIFLDPFNYEFMRRALVAGLLAVVATSLIGAWVVMRGLTFLGDALAHGVLPGIAAAQLLSVPVGLGAIGSVAVMVIGIDAVRRTKRLSEDVGIGLLFVGMLALGVVIISRSDSFSQDLTALLFGEVLGVSWSEMRIQGAAAALVAASSLLLYRPFLVLSLDETKAELLGLRPRLTHLAMLSLTSIAVVASFRVVGTLLVFGLMVAPPATAILLTSRVPSVMAMSVLLGASDVVFGLLISFHLDTAAAATVAGFAVVQFLIVLAGRLALDLIRPTGVVVGSGA